MKNATTVVAQNPETEKIYERSVTDEDGAIALFKWLISEGRVYHPEDPAAEVSGKDGELLFDADTAHELDKRMSEIYALDWSKSIHECPCALIFHLEKSSASTLEKITRVMDLACNNAEDLRWIAPDARNDMIEMENLSGDVRFEINNIISAVDSVCRNMYDRDESHNDDGTETEDYRILREAIAKMKGE